MEIGMLWFDNDHKSSIPSKVEKAARYYQEKYGVNPDLCYVHPQTITAGNGKKKGARTKKSQEPLRIGKILVLKNDKVLPDHFWIGIRNGGE
ncbi:MAG: hypothetical protein P8Y34_11200 [Anaerolineales bacterium]|jgi:hypothetical protein